MQAHIHLPDETKKNTSNLLRYEWLGQNGFEAQKHCVQVISW